MTGHGEVEALKKTPTVFEELQELQATVEHQSKELNKQHDAITWLLAIVGEGSEPLKDPGIRKHYEELLDKWHIVF